MNRIVLADKFTGLQRGKWPSKSYRLGTNVPVPSPQLLPKRQGLVKASKTLAQAQQLRQIVDHDRRVGGMAGQEVLVVSLGRMEAP